MDQKSRLWMGAVAAAALGAVVIAVAAQAPEIVPKETKALAEGAADSDVKTAAGDAAKPSLSEHLDGGEGVIKPPQGIDPEIRKPPPVGGSMKVIIPPGEPGGDPSVLPQ